MGYIEYRIAAVYHACDSLLNRVDAIQDKFLDYLGKTDKQALFDFNLAPLSVKCDMAMLGLVHRIVLEKARHNSLDFSS